MRGERSAGPSPRLSGNPGRRRPAGHANVLQAADATSLIIPPPLAPPIRSVATNVFYEEEGDFKVGAVLADNVASLQVEAPHGKRSKVKASNVLVRFEGGGLADFMGEAQ